MEQAGYKTIHVGKAHFGCIGSEGADPKNLGFDINIAGSAIGSPGSYYGENGYGAIKGAKSRAVPGLEQYFHTNTFLSDALTLEADKEIEKAENESLALQDSRESLVLLKNENNMLPLDINNVKKIAVCGPNADEEGYALTHYGP